jgi:hypothetical protein
MPILDKNLSWWTMEQWMAPIKRRHRVTWACHGIPDRKCWQTKKARCEADARHAFQCEKLRHKKQLKLTQLVSFHPFTRKIFAHVVQRTPTPKADSALSISQETTRAQKMTHLKWDCWSSKTFTASKSVATCKQRRTSGSQLLSNCSQKLKHTGI